MIMNIKNAKIIHSDKIFKSINVQLNNCKYNYKEKCKKLVK